MIGNLGDSHQLPAQKLPDRRFGEAMAAAFLAEHPPIPGYEPVRLLGRNGAIVYLARQMSNGREVVLKVACKQWFAEHLCTHDALLSHLDHPNIVRVFEMGEVEGCAYAALEYVERTLADRLREGPLQALDAAILTQKLILTIEYARDHGMVCLILTPSSILLTRENAPKLFDLRLIDVAEKGDDQERYFIMRPEFSAPEDLVSGISSAVAADIYRVGAAMYAMLTGESPFAGDKPEITTAVLSRPPAFPRQRNPAVPKDIEAICLRCLEKQPERRYATLRHLADELGRFVSSC